MDTRRGGGLPNLGPKYRRSRIWGGIVAVADTSNVRVELLSKGVGFVVGDGRCIRFWFDDLVGRGPLCELFPRLFRVVSNKEVYISDYYEVRDGSVVWGVSFRRVLRQVEEVQYRELLSILFNIFLCRSSKDSRIWKPSLSREFSAKAFYLALEGNHYSRFSSSLVWLGLVPLGVEAFYWLAIVAMWQAMKHGHSICGGISVFDTFGTRTCTRHA